jgi:UDP:flavonoid glycosyltransferase YjiC (YdhE family)
MKILVAGWDSGGGVEAVQAVVGRAVARGHQVRVLGTEGLRSRFESAGATFVRYKYAPDNDMSKPETDLVKDWQSRNRHHLAGLAHPANRGRLTGPATIPLAVLREKGMSLL